MSGIGLRRRATSAAGEAPGPEFLAAALEALPAPAATIAPDGRVRSNRLARALHDLPAGPLAQEDWAARHRVFAPDADEPLAAAEHPLVRALADGAPRSLEVEIDGAGAERERFALSAEPLRAGRRVVGAVGVLRRLPRPASATTLPDAELLRHTAEGIAVICAQTGTFVYTNDAWTNALGYAPGALAGRHVSAVTAPSDRAPQDLAGEMLEVLDRGEVWRGEVELRRRDGATVWWEHTVSQIVDERDRPAWIIVGRDTTARRAARAELRATAHRFEAAFDALPAPALLCEGDGHVVAVNEALVELAGVRREELLGRSLEAVLPPVDLDAARRLAAAGRQGDLSRYRFAARVPGMSGAGLVDVTMTLVREVDGRLLEAIALVEPRHPSVSSTS